MKNFKSVIIILLSIIVIGGIAIYFWQKQNDEKNNYTSKHEITNNSITNETKNNTNVNKVSTNNKTAIIKEIDKIVLENAVENALIQNIAKGESSIKGNGTYAEGHKILGSEIKNNQIYAYVIAEYGIYELENNTCKTISAKSSPITIIFNIKNESTYEFFQYIKPNEEGDQTKWENSLKEMFPENLIDVAKNGETAEFYQRQIKNYLD